MAHDKRGWHAKRGRKKGDGRGGPTPAPAHRGCAGGSSERGEGDGDGPHGPHGVRLNHGEHGAHGHQPPGQLGQHTLQSGPRGHSVSLALPVATAYALSLQGHAGEQQHHGAPRSYSYDPGSGGSGSGGGGGQGGDGHGGSGGVGGRNRFGPPVATLPRPRLATEEDAALRAAEASGALTPREAAAFARQVAQGTGGGSSASIASRSGAGGGTMSGGGGGGSRAAARAGRYTPGDSGGGQLEMQSLRATGLAGGGVDGRGLAQGNSSTSSSNGGGSGGALCAICLEAPAAYLVIPCGHQCGCLYCLEALRSTGGGCPICRGDMSSIIKVFQAGYVEQRPEPLRPKPRQAADPPPQPSQPPQPPQPPRAPSSGPPQPATATSASGAEVRAAGPPSPVRRGSVGPKLTNFTRDNWTEAGEAALPREGSIGPKLSNFTRDNWMG